MENTENEDQVNNIPENTSDTEMATASSADEQSDQTNKSKHTPKSADENGSAENARRPQDSLVSAPGSWQIPPGALTAPPLNGTAMAPSGIATSKAAEKIEKVEQRIRDDQYDLDAWTILINESQNSGDIAAIRDVYERVLKVFPTSARHWLGYLELELKHANFNEVENIFTRCLKTVLSVDLWKFYLNYIRRINSTEDGKLESDTRTVIEKAYDYVLNNVGIDKDSGPIWSDYIFFLKNAETTNTWEEQRKMDSMRRVYQRAVAIPLNNVEHLWKEYDQWENGLNRLTAKNFLRERSSAYMTARTALHEMKAFADTINKNVVAKPTEWSETDVQQLDAWKQYIAWETGNPLQLEDANQVAERVVYGYQQALIYQRFYPEIWYEFSNYYIEIDKPDRAIAVLASGMEVLPSSLLLHFAYVQLCESQKKIPEARKALDTLLEHLTQKIEVIEKAASDETEELSRVAAEERSAMDLGDDIDGELRERLRAKEKQIEKEKNKIKEEKDEKIAVLAKACSQVWIIYMQFMRRSEGIKNARSIFTKARKFTYCTYHVFVASALMEYYNSKEPIVAGKIFELGLKSFGDDADFVEQYLDFLIQLNDDNNTRALFERALAVMPNEKASSIWRKFADYENKYGDMSGIERVERRWREAFPSESKLSIFVDRNSYLNIQVIKDLELGGKAREAKTAPPIQVQATIVQYQIPVMSDKRGKDRKGNRTLLDAFHPERYPRPDFNQWQAHTPTADAAVAPSTTAAQAAQPPTGPAANVSVPLSKQPPPSGQLANMDLDAPPSQSRWNQGTQGAQGPLPEAVAYFLSQLPPAEAFDGPVINASSFMDIVLNTAIPPPPRVALDDRPIRQSPPPPPGAGGQFRGGMGGGRGRGRRPRDEFEENNPPHMRGMGPNRPPEYDLFRARQAKRRRDEQF